MPLWRCIVRLYRVIISCFSEWFGNVRLGGAFTRNKSGVAMRKSLWNRLFSAKSTRATAGQHGGKASRRGPQKRAVRLETLEDRRLLSITAVEYAYGSMMSTEEGDADRVDVAEILAEVEATRASALAQADAALAQAEVLYLEAMSLVESTQSQSAGDDETLSSMKSSGLVTLAAAATEGGDQISTVVTTLQDIVDPDDGFISLREAIEYANSEDTITFDVSGTITLSGTSLEISKRLVINGNRQITIDANQRSRVIRATSQNLVLNGLTITGGSVSGTGSGGGIYSYGTNANLTITNSEISGNTASYDGGGIYSEDKLTIINSEISGNTASSWGGGIYSEDTLTIINSTISGNTARYGGGICGDYGTITITDSEISRNTATAGYGGGGIYSNPGTTLTITNSEISGNTASYDGGGIVSDTLTVISSEISGNTAGGYGGGICGYGTTTITNSEIRENTTTNGWGGGIVNWGTLTVISSEISGNTASFGGGGIFSYYGVNSTTVTVKVINSEISGNTARSCGGGIYSEDKLTIINSEISGNTARSGGGICSEDMLTVINSEISANTAREYPNVCTSDPVGTTLPADFVYPVVAVFTAKDNQWTLSTDTTVTLNANKSYNASAYYWDLDGDGNYDDATGSELILGATADGGVAAAVEDGEVQAGALGIASFGWSQLHKLFDWSAHTIRKIGLKVRSATDELWSEIMAFIHIGDVYINPTVKIETSCANDTIPQDWGPVVGEQVGIDAYVTPPNGMTTADLDIQNVCWTIEKKTLSKTGEESWNQVYTQSVNHPTTLQTSREEGTCLKVTWNDWIPQKGDHGDYRVSCTFKLEGNDVSTDAFTQEFSVGVTEYDIFWGDAIVEQYDAMKVRSFHNVVDSFIDAEKTLSRKWYEENLETMIEENGFDRVAREMFIEQLWQDDLKNGMSESDRLFTLYQKFGKSLKDRSYLVLGAKNQNGLIESFADGSPRYESDVMDTHYLQGDTITNEGETAEMEVLARFVAYASAPYGKAKGFLGLTNSDWREGERLWWMDKSGNIVFTDYVVDKIFHIDRLIDSPYDPNKSIRDGFDAYGLKNLTLFESVLTIRGTFSISDFFDDFNILGVGYFEYLMAALPVTQWMQQQRDQNFDLAITGHSLGGALSQYIASVWTKAGNQLNSVITFNSAGIPDSCANQCRNENIQTIEHHISSGDIVSLSGEAFIGDDQGMVCLYSYTTRTGLIDLSYITDTHTQPLVVSSIPGEASKPTHRPTDITKQTTMTARELSSYWFHYSDSTFENVYTSFLPWIFLRGTTEMSRQMPVKWTINKLLSGIPVVAGVLKARDMVDKFVETLDFLRDTDNLRNLFNLARCDVVIQDGFWKLKNINTQLTKSFGTGLLGQGTAMLEWRGGWEAMPSMYTQKFPVTLNYSDYGLESIRYKKSADTPLKSLNSVFSIHQADMKLVDTNGLPPVDVYSDNTYTLQGNCELYRGNAAAPSAIVKVTEFGEKFSAVSDRLSIPAIDLETSSLENFSWMGYIGTLDYSTTLRFLGLDSTKDIGLKLEDAEINFGSNFIDPILIWSRNRDVVITIPNSGEPSLTHYTEFGKQTYRYSKEQGVWWFSDVVTIGSPSATGISAAEVADVSSHLLLISWNQGELLTDLAFTIRGVTYTEQEMVNSGQLTRSELIQGNGLRTYYTKMSATELQQMVAYSNSVQSELLLAMCPLESRTVIQNVSVDTVNSSCLVVTLQANHVTSNTLFHFQVSSPTIEMRVTASPDDLIQLESGWQWSPDLSEWNLSSGEYSLAIYTDDAISSEETVEQSFTWLLQSQLQVSSILKTFAPAIIGSELMRENSLRTVTITNVGNTTASVGIYPIGGSDLSEFYLLGSIAGCSLPDLENIQLIPGEMLDLYVIFAPYSNGCKSLSFQLIELEEKNPLTTITMNGEALSPPPASPNDVQATASGTSSVIVSWTSVTDATGYSVERSSDGTSGWTQVATPTTNMYTDTGLTANTTYYYRVCATNDAGNSEYSDVVSATTEEQALQPGLKQPSKAYTVAENAKVKTSVGTVSPITRAARGQTYTYTLTQGSEYFAIDAKGKITTIASIDYEATPTIEIVVQTSINGTPTWSDTFNVAIKNVDEMPVDIGILEDENIVQNTSFMEGEMVVGTLSATDPDGTAITGYKLSGNDAKLFEVVRNGDVFELRAKSPLDFENPLSKSKTNQYSVVIQATDSTRKSGKETLTINVTDRTYTIDDTVRIYGTGNTWSLQQVGENIQVVNGRTVVFSEPTAAFPKLVISGTAKKDTLTFDLKTWSSSIDVDITFDGMGDADTVKVIGTAASEAFGFTSDGVTIGNTNLFFNNVELLTVDGGDGNDVYRFAGLSATTSTTISDKKGVDTFDFSGSSEGITLDLSNTKAQTVFGRSLIVKTAPEILIGTDDADTLTGGKSGTVIYGGGGVDTLTTKGGKNVLIGGFAADQIFGSTGEDLLIGGDLDTDALPFDTLYNDWILSKSKFDARVAALSGAMSKAVQNDSTTDTLTGGKGQDWFMGDDEEIVDFGLEPRKQDRKR